MGNVMIGMGDTVAAQVFARYYDAATDGNIAFLLGKDIGEIERRTITSLSQERYGHLWMSKLAFYLNAGSFVDFSLGYYISYVFGETDEEHYAAYDHKHYGFDLSRLGGPSGDPLYAGIAGMVTKVNWNYEANGNDIQIQYGYQFENNFIGSGIFGEYLHMKDASQFSAGTYISAAAQIGQIAGTPNYDPHLHYDMLTQNGNYSQTMLTMLLGKDIQANSFRSTNGVNTVYNPLLYYTNFLGKDLYTKPVYLAMNQ
jgi:murein DD-endopeptidase MepM/ murein hydrolase activator NlpD